MANEELELELDSTHDPLFDMFAAIRSHVVEISRGFDDRVHAGIEQRYAPPLSGMGGAFVSTLSEFANILVGLVQPPDFEPSPPPSRPAPTHKNEP